MLDPLPDVSWVVGVEMAALHRDLSPDTKAFSRCLRRD